MATHVCVHEGAGLLCQGTGGTEGPEGQVTGKGAGDTVAGADLLAVGGHVCNDRA